MSYLQSIILAASLIGTCSIDSALNHQNYFTSGIIAQASSEEATPKNPQSNTENEKGTPFKWADLLESKSIIGALSAIGGAIGGALLKYLLDEMSQRNNFKRQMVTSVTKSIEELAKNYYWLLANHSSVLSGLLERYLREREQKQLVQYGSWDEAKHELDEITNKYVDDAFFYYSRLMKTIYNFQWVTGNTYFLSNYDSGRKLTRLYNRLRSLMKDIDANNIIDYIDKDLPIQTEGNSPDKVDTKHELDTLQTFMKKVHGEQDEYKTLKDEFKKFKNWLGKEVELVWEASCCLKAYSDLFSAELVILYKDWFAKGWFKKGLSPGISQEVLTLLDSKDSRDAIDFVSSEPLTLRPIGLSASKISYLAEAKEMEISLEETKEKDGKEISSEPPVDSVVPPKEKDGDRQLPISPETSAETSELSKKNLQDIYAKYQEINQEIKKLIEPRVVTKSKNFEDYLQALIGRKLLDSEKKNIQDLK